MTINIIKYLFKRDELEASPLSTGDNEIHGKYLLKTLEE